MQNKVSTDYIHRRPGLMTDSGSHIYNPDMYGFITGLIIGVNYL